MRHAVLPTVTLASIVAVRVVRLTRAGMLETQQQDYIRTARAKGVPERRVVFVHGLRNAIIPVITVAGLEFSALIGGAVVTESVFGWPGMGLQLLQAVLIRDYTVVQATAIIIAEIVVITNLVVDLLHIWADPRVKAA